MDAKLTIALTLVAFILFVSVLIYNSLIRKKNAVNNAYSSIDVYLKQRHDLIPALVSTVKEYMRHERQLLERITELRAAVVSQNLNDQRRFELEGELSRLISRLIVSVENYPDLKANQNFLHLQQTLNEVEEKIAASRRFYNSAVTELNNAIEMFPTNIFARLMKLSKRAWFEVAEQQKSEIDVERLFRT